ENDFVSDSYYENELETKILDSGNVFQNQGINLDQLIEDAKEIRRILHLKDKNKKKILDEYDKKLVVDIPTGSEETLIRELENFNHDFYNDEESIFFQKYEVPTKVITKTEDIFNEEENKNDTDELIEVVTEQKEITQQEEDLYN